jgi:hypothetical protein
LNKDTKWLKEVPTFYIPKPSQIFPFKDFWNANLAALTKTQASLCWKQKIFK